MSSSSLLRLISRTEVNTLLTYVKSDNIILVMCFQRLNIRIFKLITAQLYEEVHFQNNFFTQNPNLATCLWMIRNIRKSVSFHCSIYFQEKLKVTRWIRRSVQLWDLFFSRKWANGKIYVYLYFYTGCNRNKRTNLGVIKHEKIIVLYLIPSLRHLVLKTPPILWKRLEEHQT